MREAAYLHAKTGSFRSALARARAISMRALAANDGWYVAVSGGKDSTCVLALVRECAPAAPAVSSIQEWRLPETAEYLARVGNLALTASGTDHGTNWAPNWEGEDDIPEGVAWLGAKIGGDDRTVKNYGRSETGVFLGTRADESRARRKLMRARGPLFFNQCNQVWQCSPIAHWSVLDVWAYILSERLDYNRAYDVMERIGVPLDQQRIGPFAVEKVLGRGQLAILKQGWPAVWNGYAAAHPEARLYV